MGNEWKRGLAAIITAAGAVLMLFAATGPGRDRANAGTAEAALAGGRSVTAGLDGTAQQEQTVRSGDLPGDGEAAATGTPDNGEGVLFGMGPRDLVVSELGADLTGDGKKEMIRTGLRLGEKDPSPAAVSAADYKLLLQSGAEAVVAVLDGAASPDAPVCLEEFSYGVAHAGNGNLALTAYQGRPCLIRYDNAVYGGIGSFLYELLEILPEGGSRTLAEDGVDEYDFTSRDVQPPSGISDLMPDFWDRISVRDLEAVEEALDGYLKDAVILAAVSYDENARYLYTPGEPFVQTGLDVFALQFGEPRLGSVREYAEGWRKDMEREWLARKAALDPGWAAAFETLDTVWSDVKLLEKLKYGGVADDGRDVALDEDGLKMYRRVTDPRFPSAASVEELIDRTFTGGAAEEWRRDLLEIGFYREKDGILYRLTADYVGVSLPTENILSCAEISPEEWFLTVESGKDMLDRTTHTGITLLKTEEGWRISNMELMVDCNGLSCS